jgi:hypothetical protein
MSGRSSCRPRPRLSILPVGAGYQPLTQSARGAQGGLHERTGVTLPSRSPRSPPGRRSRGSPATTTRRPCSRTGGRRHDPGRQPGHDDAGLRLDLPVTMDDMVRRPQRSGAGAQRLGHRRPAVHDYQPSVETAIGTGRLMAETGCDAVARGGSRAADRVAGSRARHLDGPSGLTPQSVSSLGGFRLQGKGAKRPGDPG